MIDLEEIRSRHGPLIWNTVYRILKDHADALDCYQDVFYEILAGAEREVDNWPGYLRWLATRRAIDRLRTRRRRQSHFDATDVARVQSPVPEPPETAQLNELALQLRHELTRLPQRQAEAFWLSCVEDMSYEEIARQLGVDLSTIGVWIHRTRLRLRKTLVSTRIGAKEGDRHG
jgi:RNA polymerase sigma factor (sigma-70 family)